MSTRRKAELFELGRLLQNSCRITPFAFVNREALRKSCAAEQLPVRVAEQAVLAMQQARNKRNVKLIEFNGERMSLPAWAERIGVSKFSLRNRIYIYGWPIEVALTRPIMPGVHLGQSHPPKLVIMLPLEIVAAADTFAKKVTKSLL